MVEFLDYQCGFCRRAHPEIAELIASDGDIRWIVKEMPILGPGSELAARAAVATLIAEGPERYLALQQPPDAARRARSTTRASTARWSTPGSTRPRSAPRMEDPEVGGGSPRPGRWPRSWRSPARRPSCFDNQMLRGYLPLAQMRDLVASGAPQLTPARGANSALPSPAAPNIQWTRNEGRRLRPLQEKQGNA